MSNSNDKRSPLKTPPLRQAGQSLSEKLEKKLSEDLALYVFGAGFAVYLAVLEWWRWYHDSPPYPISFTIMAIVAVAWAVWKITRLRREARLIKQGRDGERVVGQLLEGLRELGFHVFHDLLGNQFNVDHVLVGPRGVFTVETKTFSKPANRESKVSFDGENVLVDGYTPDRNSITQARAQAAWLQDLLFTSTGRRFSVRPVVIYLGWYVEKAEGARSDVWVLNEKAFLRFVEREREMLAREDVHLISDRLSIHVRNANPNQES